MDTKDAGRLGGLKVKKNYPPNHFKKIGSLGGIAKREKDKIRDKQKHEK